MGYDCFPALSLQEESKVSTSYSFEDTGGLIYDRIGEEPNLYNYIKLHSEVVRTVDMWDYIFDNWITFDFNPLIVWRGTALRPKYKTLVYHLGKWAIPFNPGFFGNEAFPARRADLTQKQ